jgi:recombinational DNA repair protein RecR
MGQQLNRPGEESHTGMGAPVGSDIEYTDEITMLKGMEGRWEL